MQYEVFVHCTHGYVHYLQVPEIISEYVEVGHVKTHFPGV
jgi:hypothetical protein